MNVSYKRYHNAIPEMAPGRFSSHSFRLVLAQREQSDHVRALSYCSEAGQRNYNRENRMGKGIAKNF